MLNTMRLKTEVRRALRRPQFWFATAWIAPTLIWYAVFSFGPILRAFFIATLRYRIVDPGNSRFVGLGNFSRIAEDPLFFISIRNTFTWAGLAFLYVLPLSIFISACLSNILRGRNLYQSLVFVPVVMSLVAASLLFRMIMDPEVGHLNKLMRTFGLPGEFKWLSSSQTALVTACGIGAWKGMGFHVTILTAGMIGIPKELYDAAVVDGANGWQQFWRVTIPLLANTLLLQSVLLAIGALQEFGLVWVLTGGGPGNSTYMYNLLIFFEAFTQMRFGTATAAALMQFAVVFVISVLQIKLLRPTWSY